MSALASAAAAAGAPAEDGALEQRVAHHPVTPVRAACDLAAGIDAVEGRARVLVDHEAAVLVVENRVGQDRLGERIDAGRTVAAEHVRERDLGILLGDARRVEQHRRAAVGRLDAAARLDLVDDRLRHLVARAERVGELLAVRRSGAPLRRRASSPGSSSPASSPARRRRSGGTGAHPGRATLRPARAPASSPRRSRPGGWSTARRAPPPRGSSGRRPRGRPSPPRARARRSVHASRSPSAPARAAATS